MTKEELKVRLDASQEKVDKRLNTLKKVCKKLNVDETSILNKVDNFERPFNYKHIQEYFNIYYLDANSYRVNGRYTERYEDAYAYNELITNLFDNIFKLKELQEIRNNWKVKYDTQVNKENIVKIPVLVDFLNEWRIKAYDWYLNNCEFAVEMANKFHQVAYDFLKSGGWFGLDYRDRIDQTKNYIQEFNDLMHQKFNATHRYSRGPVDEDDVFRAYNINSLTLDIISMSFTKSEDESYSQTFGYQENKGSYVLRKIDTEKLNKILDKEVQAKYDDLCNRITAVVGNIEDVSKLYIAPTGQLNGIVIGSLGSAKVETIGAGGWNIQCWHYRTLVNKLK